MLRDGELSSRDTQGQRPALASLPCLPRLEGGRTSLGPHPPGPGSQGTNHSGRLGPTVFWTTWDEQSSR